VSDVDDFGIEFGDRTARAIDMNRHAKRVGFSSWDVPGTGWPKLVGIN